MGMSDFYGPANEAESIATIHAALDAGITLLDTGDYYAAGHNELLIREALRGGDRGRVAISVKFGLLRAPDGQIVEWPDLHPPLMGDAVIEGQRWMGRCSRSATTSHAHGHSCRPQPRVDRPGALVGGQQNAVEVESRRPS
jgi:aryl-alcohol dehydrogenase-like predicted oxidoreductase